MSENIPWRDRPVFPGTITSVETKPYIKFIVLLDNERTVTASVSQYVARLMFRIRVCDRVLVRFRDSPKSPIIIDFEKK